jgi:hypothetical protein
LQRRRPCAKPLPRRVEVKSGDFFALALACTPVQAALHRFERIPIAPQRGCVEIVNTFLALQQKLRGLSSGALTPQTAEMVFLPKKRACRPLFYARQHTQAPRMMGQLPGVMPWHPGWRNPCTMPSPLLHASM